MQVDRLALMHLRRNLLDIRTAHQARNVFPPIRPAYPQWLTCKIIGGQVSNGVDMLSYAPYGDLYSGQEQADMAYDPDTDTAYIAGLGYGVLFDAQGQETANVLIRHDWLGWTDSFGAGYRVVVGTSYLLPVSGGGTISVYPIVSL
jgi:hypothetical protein